MHVITYELRMLMKRARRRVRPIWTSLVPAASGNGWERVLTASVLSLNASYFTAHFTFTLGGENAIQADIKISSIDRVMRLVYVRGVVVNGRTRRTRVTDCFFKPGI